MRRVYPHPKYEDRALFIGAFMEEQRRRKKNFIEMHIYSDLDELPHAT